ncbi:protein neprosin-like [Tasmannia lanceolata]|uniref:protein neprosin-like n=1 Tax=Tasmannia lanceolata TaxID=3420 RepID=UPI004063ECB2
MGFIEEVHGRFMALNGIIVIFLLALSLVVVVRSHREEGWSTRLSREEDLNLDRQLKLLKKPAIKTIQTEYGQIFDCVDMYKQPAFDHPLLKNHTIRESSGSLPKGMIVKEASFVHNPFEIGLKDGGCPQGTVPIRRIQKQDLINSKSLKKFPNRYSSEVVDSPFRLATKGLEPERKYYGTKATLNIWSPKVIGRQAINTNIFLDDDIGGRIQVGCLVNPTLYGDSYPHLHSYWTADDSEKTGCDDILCPGFIQVSKSIPMGLALLPVSEYNGTQYDKDFTIYKDPVSKDWWLLLGDEQIGYWPKTLFTTRFADFATLIDWGGVVYNPGTEAWPPMGSGHFPTEGYTRASYIANILLIDEDGNHEKFDELLVSNYVESPDCYLVLTTTSVPIGGYSMLFGGPGGKCPFRE